MPRKGSEPFPVGDFPCNSGMVYPDLRPLRPLHTTNKKIDFGKNMDRPTIITLKQILSFRLVSGHVVID